MSNHSAPSRPGVKPYRRSARIPGRFGAGLLPATGFGPFVPTGPDPDDLDWWEAELERREMEFATYADEPTEVMEAIDFPVPLRPPILDRYHAAVVELEIPDLEDPRWDDTRLCPCGRMAEDELCKCESFDPIAGGSDDDAVMRDEPTPADWAWLDAQEREYPPSGSWD